MDCNSERKIFESKEGLLSSFLNQVSALRQKGLEGALGLCSKLHTPPYRPRALLIHTPLRISSSLFLLRPLLPQGPDKKGWHWGWSEFEGRGQGGAGREEIRATLGWGEAEVRT